LTFHILNGDALAERFPSEIDGERIIFRECLIEGPLEIKSSDRFLDARDNYLSSTYPGNAPDYYTKFVKPELQKVVDIPNGSDVYLWFEEDLFCLMNAWFVMYQLSNIEKNLQIYWIHPPMTIQYGFGGLSPNELKHAPNHAKKINSKDLETAALLWRLIAKEDYESISDIRFSEDFEFLNTGTQLLLNLKVEKKPELLLKELISNTENPAFGAIFRKFHATAPEYGLGDLQVKRLYDKIVTH
jgi:hypothetical protein